jgi:hypothetical protein
MGYTDLNAGQYIALVKDKIRACAERIGCAVLEDEIRKDGRTYFMREIHETPRRIVNNSLRDSDRFDETDGVRLVAVDSGILTISRTSFIGTCAEETGGMDFISHYEHVAEKSGDDDVLNTVFDSIKLEELF